jgi:hypothetical protein
MQVYITEIKNYIRFSFKVYSELGLGGFFNIRYNISFIDPRGIRRNTLVDHSRNFADRTMDRALLTQV